MVFPGRESAFVTAAGGDDFYDSVAPRDAEAMARVELAKCYFVDRVQNHGDATLLLHAHSYSQPILPLSNHIGLKDLWSEVLGIPVKVPQQSFEVRGAGPRNKGSSPPVVEQRSGQSGVKGGCEIFDDSFTTPEPYHGIGSYGRKKGIRRPMLLAKSQLDCLAVGAEEGISRWCGFTYQVGGRYYKEQQAENHVYDAFHVRIVHSPAVRSNAGDLTRGTLFLTA